MASLHSCNLLHQSLRVHDAHNFLIKTDKKIYLVETRSDRDFEKDPDVVTKALNARKMTSLFSKVPCPFSELNQPQEWEYVLIPESRFNENINLSFE
jgi:hypothetical protein